MSTLPSEIVEEHSETDAGDSDAEKKRVVRVGEEECFKRHERWIEAALAPRIRLLVISTVGAFIAVGTGVLFYITNNTVRDYDIKATEKFVSVRQYERDMDRINDRMATLSAQMSAGFDAISDKLDRQHVGVTKSPTVRFDN